MKSIKSVLSSAVGPGPIDLYVDPAPEVRMFHSESRTGAVGQSSVPITVEQLGEMAYVERTNYRGERVWVSPLCHIHGEPAYPPVDIPPGEKRREAEAAIEQRYRAYRREKQERQKTARPRNSATDDWGYER